MKIHVEFNSVSEMVNFGKFVGSDLVQVPATDKQKAETAKYKSMYETTLANLERAYERILMLDPKGKTANKTKKDMDSEVEKLLKTPVGELPISVRAFNCLRAENIETVGQLVSLSANELKHIPNLGKGTVKEIREVLASVGLKLKGE